MCTAHLVIARSMSRTGIEQRMLRAMMIQETSVLEEEYWRTDFIVDSVPTKERNEKEKDRHP